MTLYVQIHPMAKLNSSKYAVPLCVVLLIFTISSVKESAVALHYRASTKTAGLLFQHRSKVYLEKKETGFKIIGMPEVGRYNYWNRETPEERELRRVPAGPNPLHHNGRDPKNPRTP